MKIKQFLNLWAPVIFWCLVIFSLSSMHTIETTEFFWWDFIMKKSAHITEYAILYWLFLRAVSKNFSFPRQKFSKLAFYSLLFTLFYASTDEFHQRFVPGRHSKLMDIGFDFTGMLISLFLIKNKFLPLKLKNKK